MGHFVSLILRAGYLESRLRGAFSHVSATFVSCSKIFILLNLVKSVAINLIFGEAIVFDRYIILLGNPAVFQSLNLLNYICVFWIGCLFSFPGKVKSVVELPQNH